MLVHLRALLAAGLAVVGVTGAASTASLAAESPSLTAASSNATARPVAPRGVRAPSPRFRSARPPTLRSIRPKLKPRAIRPTKRPARRSRGAVRLAFAGRPVNLKDPSFEGVIANGGTARLNVGAWRDAERYWIDLWRWKASTGWVLLSRNDLGTARSLTVPLDRTWGDSWIGFHAFAYNSWYGWSGAVWSGEEYVPGYPVNKSSPRFDDSVYLGNTVNLDAGAWTAAERYWIEVWRWTSAAGWVRVSTNDFGASRVMPLYLGPEWHNSWVGFYAWGYNGAFGWAKGEWSDAVYVQPDAGRDRPADDIDTPGVVRNESGVWGWWLSNDFHANVAHYVRFQYCCPTPLIGDWDGDGVDTPGVNSGGNRWTLSDGYEGSVDYDFYYGNPGDVPLVGDWDGDGDDTIAIRRGHCFYWKNSLAGGWADNVTCFGNPDDKPVVGDWDGNGTDTPGVYRHGEWWLNNDFSGAVHGFVRYGGAAGDRPIPGDFDADGDDTPGIHRHNQFHLSNDLSGTTHLAPVYGNPGDFAIVGDYDSEPAPTFENESSFAFASSGDFRLAAVPDVVRRYAPRLVLSEHEDVFPMAVGRFIQESSLRWAYRADAGVRLRRKGKVEPYRLGMNGQPYRAIDPRTGKRLALKEGGRVMVSTDCTRPHQSEEMCPERRFLAAEEGFALQHDGPGVGLLNPTGSVPTYYRFENRWYITYWFFYGESHPHAMNPIDDIDHDADWERIAIRLDGNNNPTHIALSRHGCFPTYRWARANKWNEATNRVDANGTHPVIFVAADTHGSYLSTSPHLCPEAPEEDDVDDGRPDGQGRWNTWDNLLPVRDRPWWGFGGAWGDVGNRDFTTGPLGPSPYKRAIPPHW
jgi:hypothetical protein